MPPSVSVVVPTLNEGSGITALLDSLHSQSYPITEIVVADGGSTDGTREVAAADPTVRLIANPKRHAAAGRNAALERCTTEWVLFTDGDCRPAATWAEELMAATLRAPDVVGVGGRVIAEPVTVYERVCAQMLLDVILGYRGGSRAITEKGLGGALITANCGYRRDILDKVGGFDERFSNFGEDIDLMFRVLDLKAGTLLHATDAVVIGDMPATLIDTIGKWRQYGLASSYLNKYHFQRRSVDVALYRRLAVLMLQAVQVSGDLRTEALVGAVQLAAHIGGKLEGSARLRTVNL